METRSSLAAQLYQSAKPATKATPQDLSPDQDFAKIAQDFATILQNGEQTAKDAMIGKADPQSLVQALAQTQLAVETAVTVRDKIVEAYQEILRMPV
ncbi:MAG: flagellar hook-basal body complex protein FliE [Paracoccaceae bacterium]|jgi:flagellar hook-basal body complex protein FliE